MLVVVHRAFEIFDDVRGHSHRFQELGIVSDRDVLAAAGGCVALPRCASRLIVAPRYVAASSATAEQLLERFDHYGSGRRGGLGQGIRNNAQLVFYSRLSTLTLLIYPLVLTSDWIEERFRLRVA